ncbi:MAG: hypothetical protein HKN67_08485 [Saprospiraceae bacterium]|nr:hypothetical protein [Saprospiraceae bacterium]
MITLGTIVISCNNRLKPESDPLKEYAIDRFGEGYLQDFNQTNEYVILSKQYKIRPSDPFPTLRFEVLEIKNMEVIFNDNLRDGEASWIKDYIIEVKSLKGIPGPEGQNTKDNTYRFNVQNRKKFTGGFF